MVANIGRHIQYTGWHGSGLSGLSPAALSERRIGCVLVCPFSSCLFHFAKMAMLYDKQRGGGAASKTHFCDVQLSSKELFALLSRVRYSPRCHIGCTGIATSESPPAVEARQPSPTILTSSPRLQATLGQATLGHAVMVQCAARTLGLCLGCVVTATVGLRAQDLRRGERNLNPPICVGSEAGWLHLARVDLLDVVQTCQRD